MWRKGSLILVAIGVALAVAVVAACSGAGSGTTADGTGDAAAAQTASFEEIEATADAAPADAVEATPASGSALAISGPQVIQTASLEVSVPKGDFEDAIDRARTIATGLGGFVTGSSASQGDGSRLVRGTIVLRVPAQAYGQAMSALAKLGEVEAREESGEDVSAQVVDLEARQRHLEAVETQLLEFLDQTKTVGQALAVQSRLNGVQLELEQVRGQLRYLADQTAFATLTLDVYERGAPVVPPDDGFGPGDAWEAAVSALQTVGSGLLVALVTAGPFLLVVAAALLGWRLIRRRRAGATSAPTPTPQA